MNDLLSSLYARQKLHQEYVDYFEQQIKNVFQMIQSEEENKGLTGEQINIKNLLKGKI